MPPKRPTPTTFDGWLGSVIEGLIAPHGGRPRLVSLLGVSDKTVQRKIAGATPFTVSELELIANVVDVPARKIAETALSQFGGTVDKGIEKLMSEATGIPDELATKRVQKATRGMTADEIDNEYEQGNAVAQLPAGDEDDDEPAAP